MRTPEPCVELNIRLPRPTRSPAVPIPPHSSPARISSPSFIPRLPDASVAPRDQRAIPQLSTISILPYGKGRSHLLWLIYIVPCSCECGVIRGIDGLYYLLSRSEGKKKCCCQRKQVKSKMIAASSRIIAPLIEATRLLRTWALAGVRCESNERANVIRVRARQCS